MIQFVLFESNPWTGLNVLGIYSTYQLAEDAITAHDGHKSNYYIVPCELDRKLTKNDFPLYPFKHKVA